MEEGKAKDGENTKRGETRDKSEEKTRKESILIHKKVGGTSVIHAITEAYFLVPRMKNMSGHQCGVWSGSSGLKLARGFDPCSTAPMIPHPVPSDCICDGVH